MAEAPKLKDYFTPEVVAHIGDRIKTQVPTFETATFTTNVLNNGWGDLTFTERSQRIADELWTGMSLPVRPALEALVASLPDELAEPDGVLNEGFDLWPYGDLIASYAVSDLDAGLEACYELTKRFTAEFAIRPFLATYPEALDRLAPWVDDPNEHVRRLVSEGTRPRLPWASRLDLPTDQVLDLLAKLRRDQSLYVRRSVANHLNDLAKADSERIVSVLEQWHAEGVAETAWIVRHAMRNHLKNGDPRVLAIFGYAQPKVTVTELNVIPAQLPIGDDITLTFDVASQHTSPQQLMIDIVVGYRKANGTISPKVFKYRELELGAKDTPAAIESCTKKLAMVQRSTRKLYAGDHSVTI